MTKKEQEPRDNDEKRSQQTDNLGYNPDITNEDKEVLNNQSEDENKGEYFKEREEPIDFEGEDLDIPEFDNEKFNSTRNQPDESELDERPKETAEDWVSSDSESDTIYKGEDAEKYTDPSKKSRDPEEGNNPEKH